MKLLLAVATLTTFDSAAALADEQLQREASALIGGTKAVRLLDANGGAALTTGRPPGKPCWSFHAPRSMRW